jgi:heme-degrading monooxygenase HmoA
MAWGITVSYWRDEASIIARKRNAEHQHVQQGGQAVWDAV